MSRAEATQAHTDTHGASIQTKQTAESTFKNRRNKLQNQPLKMKFYCLCLIKPQRNVADIVVVEKKC